jgi:hypothetical protein
VNCHPPSSTFIKVKTFALWNAGKKFPIASTI